VRSLSSDEIRDAFLDFFVARDHRRLPSAPLVPTRADPSTLLISAGMHPLKPYFLGQEPAPHPRLTTCQKCFRTPDIDKVGLTTRHLTFFEMLGNFSIGDYFKQGAVELAWELSLDAFGFDPDRIWITVFEGDEELGLGPDEEAIEAWLSVGVPRERIVACPRSENFWQAGPLGPCGPCSELYLDRGLEFGSPDDLPGGENERFLEYWNLVFMQYDQNPANVLTPLPTQNIDTGLGLNRLAAILQDVPSVFETDQFAPLIALGEELSGRAYGEDPAADRALRVLADHGRGMTFLVADGVVPSNEERGYVLRRVMRRAIQRGRSLGLPPGFLPRYGERVIELMGSAYPELPEQREAIATWLRAEEESFGRTLEQGTRLLDELIARARERGAEGLAAEDAFRLHDTYGFPIDLTLELVAEHGLGVDEEGFEGLMAEQRRRARAASGQQAAGRVGDEREQVRRWAAQAGFTTEFTGYEALEQRTAVGALEPAGDDGRLLVKLPESPFYPAGGGQVSDTGVLECEDGGCAARVADVLRVGDDQVLAVEPLRGALEPGERVIARVDRDLRHATACHHTATHLLHAALRQRLGAHVRQAGSAVQPDKLRFDFTHGHALSAEELRDVEDRVNAWILADLPVRAVLTTLDEARELGAMALFGEKYGDVVRMVEVGDGSFSRELCGGTHVHATAEVGAFRILSETSSAANVRRIEALAGPPAIELLRAHDRALVEVAARLRTRPEGVVQAVERAVEERRELRRRLERGERPGNGAVDPAALVAAAEERDGARVLVTDVAGADPQALMGVMDRVRDRLAPAVVVLGTAAGGSVSLVAAVTPELVQRGLKAGTIVREAAQAAGGGGGGRDTMARAGARDPARLPDALAAARAAIDEVLPAP
jgi:alanyl-tRNA synthetase